jgi:hypothetical protein
LTIFSNLQHKLQLWLLSKRKKAPQELQAAKLETVDALRRLTRQPDWDIYRQLLDVTVSAQVQALLAGASDAEVHRLRGYIQGLLHSVQLAENIVAQEDNAADRKQRIAGDASRRADAARSSLYATGHWDN